MTMVPIKGDVRVLLTAVLIPAPEGGYTASNPETGTTSRGETIDELQPFSGERQTLSRRISPTVRGQAAHRDFRSRPCRRVTIVTTSRIVNRPRQAEHEGDRRRDSCRPSGSARPQSQGRPRLIRAVIDTNVLVSGMLSGEGPPGVVLSLAVRGLIGPVFNRAIVTEYERVLHWPRFGFAVAEVTRTLETIEGVGLETQDGVWPEPLPDEDDGKFLVAAQAADAALIIGNLRDFPAPSLRRIQAMSPRQFIELHAEEILNFRSSPS